MASAANYVVDDLKKTPEQPGPGSYEPEDAANYLAREGVLEAASFNMEGLNPTDPDDRRQIIKLMDSTARAWASRSMANPKTNPFYHVVLSWKEGEQPTIDQLRLLPPRHSTQLAWPLAFVFNQAPPISALKSRRKGAIAICSRNAVP